MIRPKVVAKPVQDVPLVRGGKGGRHGDQPVLFVSAIHTVLTTKQQVTRFSVGRSRSHHSPKTTSTRPRKTASSHDLHRQQGSGARYAIHSQHDERSEGRLAILQRKLGNHLELRWRQLCQVDVDVVHGRRLAGTVCLRRCTDVNLANLSYDS